MIAGVTHLTMEAQLGRAAAWACELGFEPDFYDDVELPPGFEGVEDSGASLPLAVLTGGQGIRLEVVQHRWQTGQPGAYTAIFQCKPPAGSIVSHPHVGAILQRANALREPICVAMNRGEGEAWFESSCGSGGLVGVLCHARDVPAEAAFWSRFARTRWHEVRTDAAWGSMPSHLLQAQCDLVIIHREEIPGTFCMNDAGFPSLGVFSTHLDRDCEKAVAAGGKLRSGPVITAVGGRFLRMALISAPSGAPIELLALPRSCAK
jgi:hypothetical protein